MIEILKSKLLVEAGFPDHGFTSRKGGVSEGAYASFNLAHDVGDDPVAVAENLRRLEETRGRGRRLARAVQVHGVEVVEAKDCVLESWSAAPTVEADGVIVRSPGLTAAVQTADCAAVLLADPSSGMAAAVHVGWRGAAKGVLRNTVRRMRDLGAAPGGILAAVGPCICARCYEVDEDVAKRFPESADPIKGRPGKFLLDLPYAVEVSLLAAGLSTPNIERVGGCTSCEGDRFFSHRKSGGGCGRSLGFIAPPA